LLEIAERLADGRRADPQLFGDSHLVQPLTRRELTGRDRRLQLVGDHLPVRGGSEWLHVRRDILVRSGR
jgi:hypothetical protein